MRTPTPGPSPLPVRAQPVIAAALVIALVAMAVWFVVSGGLRGGLVHHELPPGPGGGFTVNVNTATVDELAQLPGIGPATARRIVDHRRAQGPFGRIESLLDVPGIGAATLAEMRPYLRPIRGPAGAP